MLLTFRYRLLPTKRQHRALEALLEGQRQLYNAALEERIDAYRKRGITLRYYEQSRSLTEWRQSDPEAVAVPVALQRWTLKRVHEAYEGFFRRVKRGAKPGFPRVRGKNRFDTFGFAESCGIRICNGRIRFKGMVGSLRMHIHRPLPEGAKVKACVFRRDVGGWHVGIAVRMSAVPPRAVERVVGIDLGISIFAALSDGGFIPSLRAARKAERRLRLAQRARDRRRLGSGGRRKAKLEVARCHAATARARANHLHQASARIVRDYDVIVIEKLAVKGLARGFLAKDVHDASWAKFISILRYKAECAGARVVEVSPFNTSQICSACGALAPKQLGDRQHECSACGFVSDRDLNAAKNILNRAGVGPGLHNVADDACVQAETSP